MIFKLITDIRLPHEFSGDIVSEINVCTIEENLFCSGISRILQQYDLWKMLPLTIYNRRTSKWEKNNLQKCFDLKKTNTNGANNFLHVANTQLFDSNQTLSHRSIPLSLYLSLFVSLLLVLLYINIRCFLFCT